MSEPASPSSAAPAKKKVGGRKPGSKSLTVAQKAEAVALWRGGEVTLEDLSKKFKKRPETFSRLFSRMGIKKGAASEELAKKMAAKVEARALSSVDEQLTRIAAMKDEQYKMQSGLAKIAWAEIVRARQAGLDLAGLKELMQTIKLAGEIFGNARKELYTVLGVEEMDKREEFDDLPELTVRELTQNEVGQLRDTVSEDDALDTDPGATLTSDDVELS
jgi:hypothetical protein